MTVFSTIKHTQSLDAGSALVRVAEYLYTEAARSVTRLHGPFLYMLSNTWRILLTHILISALSKSEPTFYHALTSVLDEEQQKQMNAVFVLADQRKAQQDSKRIEQSGGMLTLLF